MIIGIIVANIYLLIGVYTTTSYIKEFGKASSIEYLATTIFWPVFLFMLMLNEPNVLDRYTPIKYIKKFYEYLVDKF